MLNMLYLCHVFIATRRSFANELNTTVGLFKLLQGCRPRYNIFVNEHKNNFNSEFLEPKWLLYIDFKKYLLMYLHHNMMLGYEMETN